jgi:hypothetical protein
LFGNSSTWKTVLRSRRNSKLTCCISIGSNNRWVDSNFELYSCNTGQIRKTFGTACSDLSRQIAPLSVFTVHAMLERIRTPRGSFPLIHICDISRLGARVPLRNLHRKTETPSLRLAQDRKHIDLTHARSSVVASNPDSVDTISSMCTSDFV